jgi:hypothetical protein
MPKTSTAINASIISALVIGLATFLTFKFQSSVLIGSIVIAIITFLVAVIGMKSSEWKL